MSSLGLYVLHHNTALSLSVDPTLFHLKVNMSAKGVGYALFVVHPSQAILVGVNSKGYPDDVSSFFLGELKGLVGALNDTNSSIQSRLVVLWTDYQSVFKRLTRKLTEPKKNEGQEGEPITGMALGKFSFLSKKLAFCSWFRK